MNPDVLIEENERLRRENARLQSALEQFRSESEEPVEVIRALRQGEVDALVVQENGHEEIYSLQRFDSVYRSVVEECFPFGVWLADPDGKLLYVSPSFLEFLQTDLQEMQEQGQFHFLPPETRARVEREWASCRETGQTCQVEYTLHFGDGSERVIWTHGTRTRTHDGLPRWVGVNIDMTERRAMEDRLRKQAETLREADQRKDEFLAQLGHELRNPLAAFQAGLHVLFLPDNAQSDLAETRLMMEKQIGHLTRMVDDLLDVSRITCGKIQLRKEQLDLAAEAMRAVESARPLVDSQNHRLTVSLPTQPVHLSADPTRLEQILLNLLNNAAKYTDPGGHISLSVEENGGEAVIRVKDTGVGISAEFLPKVFEVFTQADRNLSRCRGGLGIGLALVQKLAEMHGGRAEAHSDGIGKGSEFLVRLPALPRASAGKAAPRATPQRGGRSVRVLVVDDSVDLTRVFKRLLESAGHEVQVVHDGTAALVACRTSLPDVVLLDIGLPGMDGYEVARQLRGEHGDKTPLIVAMSGHGQEDDKRHALDAGCDVHMTTPVDPPRLAAVIASAPAAVKR